MQIDCEKCKETFQSKPAPCPDNREGCCVAHFNKDSFLCPCGHDMAARIGDAFRNGPIYQEEGIAIINVAAIRKLNLFR